MKLDEKKSFGSASPIILFLAGLVIIATLIAAIMIATKKPPAPPEETEQKKREPVYEVAIGDTKLKLKEAKVLGDILKVSESSRYSEIEGRLRKDIPTTEKFIEVEISAENVGMENIPSGSWKMGDLIDSEGRRFSYLKEADFWISEENSKCGALLKPGFTPLSCGKIYEVAKISQGLRLEVFSKEELTEYQRMKNMLPSEKKDYLDIGL